MQKPCLDQKIHLTIQRLGFNGEGVGYWNGFILFVEGALPGEAITARVTEVRKTFGRAEIFERLTSSSNRVTPPCPLFGECGGCQLMHLDYPAQLTAKRQYVVDALERIGKLQNIEILPCIPSPSTLAYRNKIQLPVSSDLKLGLYAHNSHRLVEIERCYIHCPLGEKVFKTLQQMLKKFPIDGKLRHVLIKTAVHTHQVLVILVSNGEAELNELAQAIIEAHPEIKGVVQNIHNTQENVILGSAYRTLAGVDFLEEQFCGLSLSISPASFFQVNPHQAELLTLKALKWASLQGDETVLDAYCGVGTHALVFAKKVKKVIGVECVLAAVENAKKNAEKNRIFNAQFLCAPAEELVSTLSNVDIALLNPPRKGCERTFLEKLAKLRPRTILYISCNPATLARDLAILSENQYQVQKVQPFDMFPQTSHVESLALLTQEA